VATQVKIDKIQITILLSVVRRTSNMIGINNKLEKTVWNKRRLLIEILLSDLR
jgi:hypothetical protein